MKNKCYSGDNSHERGGFVIRLNSKQIYTVICLLLPIYLYVVWKFLHFNFISFTLFLMNFCKSNFILILMDLLYIIFTDWS